MVHYFEKEAVNSYTSYLQLVESGAVENVPAPTLAIEYYGLPCDARLSDLIQCVRADEQLHAIVNAGFANSRGGAPKAHATSYLTMQTQNPRAST